jgi:dihydrofolate reductase
MKLAAVAEGETEIGSADGHDPGRGVATILIERLLRAAPGDSLEIVPIKLSWMRRSTGGPRGESNTAQLAVNAAAAQSCDGVILFRDADAQGPQRREENMEGLRAGMAQVARPIPAVLALQINMIEAWLLGDPDAYLRAFGRRRADLPRRPEALWGSKRDERSNHPYHVYRRILDDLGLQSGQRAAIAIAEHADLGVLARECPEGFGRFKMDFERAFRPFACVVAADVNNGIGKDNDLPWPKLKADLKHFRDVTSAAAAGKRNAVIMGRRTWDSIPAKYRPMPDRLNVVITRGTIDVPEGVIVAHSLDEALNRASLAEDVDKLMVVGGGEIFRQAFAHVRCRDVYLTRIDHAFEVDAHIPDVRERFVLAETMATHHDAGFTYAIERWTRPTQRPGT